jgi:hypothetical protein
METIEFHTTIKNGIIEVPPEYQAMIKNRVRVILVPEGKKSRRRNLIDRLLDKPVRVKEFRPLNRDELYDR